MIKVVNFNVTFNKFAVSHSKLYYDKTIKISCYMHGKLPLTFDPSILIIFCEINYKFFYRLVDQKLHTDVFQC